MLALFYSYSLLQLVQEALASRRITIAIARPGIASRQKISSALAYLFIFKQPLFVLLYLSKPLSLAGNLVQQGP
ncbi:hypothetical protein V6N11_053162 [Hibiscus sabdariffa]|uniref:Uncharacterized protein n=1 Tax=Hibiscus sabdariffa TaxID=183260 RepID=A0ABR2UCG1_9ROSI